jgi:putative ABC transport system ATP-binding protein
LTLQLSSTKFDGISVRCRGLTKVYGHGATEVFALRGVDLDVKKGELLMMMGPSGSGKTTLISVIAGILTQTQGECIVGGKNFAEMSNGEKTAFRGRHIGFVFQRFNLIPMISCAENVMVPLLLAGVDRKVALEKARAMLASVGIPEKAESFPPELSGGQQQRVVIARAMIHAPDLIVCDEPTSALDHESGGKIMELLQAIAKRDGKTLIVVTHDPRIVHFADRIAKLEDGRIVNGEHAS